MGLLTDPSAGQGKLIKLLLKYYSKLCILLYVGAVVYFALLASPQFNGRTYISENALLPGLVKSDFWDDSNARLYHQELLDEMEKYDSSIPYPWLLAKFRQIGLDTYTHNFTLQYPLGRQQSFSGKNVYGILRAPRASSTEALVLSVPYRPPKSVHTGTAPSIAIMLAFAKFSIDKRYWAKDIIFLITEHEQLGMQAWLEAYHGISCGQKDVLISGDMKGRAGAIQAAINLEFHEPAIGSIDIKIEGLNGQLPNLDLFNLAAKIATKEDIKHTFKGRSNKKFNDMFAEWKYSFETMLSMIATQATGVPNGNHGLYYRFGIQAVTLEGFAPASQKQARPFFSQGRLLEGIFRSLNNLLERFHQSFFFYLLAASDRYVSIGLYIPAIAVLAATLYIKAYAKWCQLHDTPQVSNSEDDEPEEKEKSTEDDALIDQKTIDNRSLKEWQELFDREVEKKEENQSGEINLGYVGLVISLSHLLGFSLQYCPYHYAQIGRWYNYPTDVSIFVGLLILSCLTVAVPMLLPKASYKSMSLLHVLALIELGTTLVCISMYNISLGMFIGVLYVPFVLMINPTDCGVCRYVQRGLWYLAHPFHVLIIAVLLYTFVSFSGEFSGVEDMLVRGLTAAHQAIVFSIVDAAVYGNWLYQVLTGICLSNWLCLWFVCLSRPSDGAAASP